MRIVIQEVLNSKVEVEGKEVASIKRGELILVAFKVGDDEALADKMIAKLLKLRIFPDDKGLTNWSLEQIGGEILAVSQFTLYGSVKDGNRPSFVDSMPPDAARKLFEHFQAKLSSSYPHVQYGIFQTDMKVSLVNDGPFTLLLDSEELFKKDV